MKGGHIATASARGFRSIDHQILLAARLYLGRVVRLRAPREALLDKRVDVDAQIDPPVSDDHLIWDASMHLIRNNTLCTVTEH